MSLVISRWLCSFTTHIPAVLLAAPLLAAHTSPTPIQAEKGKTKLFCLMCMEANSTELWEPCDSGPTECKTDLMPGFKKSDFPIHSGLKIRGLVGVFFLTETLLFLAQFLALSTCAYTMGLMASKNGEMWKKVRRGACVCVCVCVCVIEMCVCA